MVNPVRTAARALRLRIASGETLALEEAVSLCVPMLDALTAFDAIRETDDGIFVECCGAPALITSGIFGDKVDCPRCGAKAVDATSPMFSPLLERGKSHITLPSPQWLDLFGKRTWLVMHEGNRP
jgi:hypothetical protein